MDNSINKALRKFQVRNEKLSTYYILTTAVLGYLCVFVAVLSFNIFPWITFLLYPIIFILLARSISLLHDAGHNSLFKKKWKNSAAGNLMGVLNMIPLHFFSYMHNKHHATSGNLGKRDINPELRTMTTEEYLESSKLEQLKYQFLRSVFSRLLLTPLGLLIAPRIPFPMLDLKGKLSAIIYNIIIGGVIFLSSQFGFALALLVGYFIPLFACYILVAIVFYLQHQFEDTLWLDKEEWNYYDAAFEGSSFLKFGSFMKEISINIGYHHIHHMNPAIPGYNLSKAHDYVKDNIRFKEVRISQVFHHMRGKLWDSKAKKLIHFSEINGFKSTV